MKVPTDLIPDESGIFFLKKYTLQALITIKTEIIILFQVNRATAIFSVF